MKRDLLSPCLLLLSIACSAPVLSCAEPPACIEGDALFRARAYDRAQTVLWDCVTGGAVTPESAHQLTLTYRELKNYRAGLDRATSILASAPESEDVLYVAGFLQFRLLNHRESVRLLGEAYRLRPSDWRVHQLFALNYVVLDIGEGALAEFRNALALNPSNPELHYQLARFYHSDGRVEDSIVESRKALELFPEYPEAFQNLALCYEAAGEEQLARDNFARAIQLLDKFEQKDEWPFLHYGEFLLKHGDVEASTRIFQRALSVNPRSAKANYFMGRAMRTLGRNEEARVYLQKATVADPADPAPWFELGTLLTRLGDREGAKPVFERFQALRKAQQTNTGAGMK